MNDEEEKKRRRRKRKRMRFCMRILNCLDQEGEFNLAQKILRIAKVRQQPHNDRGA